MDKPAPTVIKSEPNTNAPHTEAPHQTISDAVASCNSNWK